MQNKFKLNLLENLLYNNYSKLYYKLKNLMDIFQS